MDEAEATYRQHLLESGELDRLYTGMTDLQRSTFCSYTDRMPQGVTSTLALAKMIIEECPARTPRDYNMDNAEEDLQC